ncbi:NAD(P)/FAD-dependent oxidoreductase [Candidatus Parabeggiatoa sp. HSG14]|uniref:NAD(P)/FAD-dependent oxidoreductase n=1 Tax=Candidatus Parabeggiatoa sp. HSG14 TaxID=3055593 RepID=UPI0025A69CA4|nr:NAD(P)/FAD-dependent oxidoreductase [Thiotrichales bacterium HSG14]
MNKNTKKIAVIGSGPMGLVCAYELLKKHYQVDVYEKDDRLGGMSACFDFDGLTIERYYHFICRTDTPLFNLLNELNIADKLHWRDTKMGFFYNGVLYKWGDPIHLLKFPKLGFISKLRYALHVFYTKNINNWENLDKQSASVWLKKWIGKKAYDKLWDYLFELKFYEHKDNISAAWIGTRIKRVALSRKNLFTETLGYLEGGSDTLLCALEEKILAMNGTIHFSAGIERLVTEKNQVQGVIVKGEKRAYDGVISTMPLPYVPRIAPNLPEEIINKIKSINNCGVVCVILKLRSPLTENFWLNVNDPDMEIPGLIEYTNLYAMPKSIVYIPFYMPHTHPKYTLDDSSFINEVFDYLHRINSAFTKEWVLAAQVSRYEFAQPICTPNFFEQLPPMQTPIQGFVMADTSYYYPEDRSISESVKVGKTLADLMA